MKLNKTKIIVAGVICWCGVLHYAFGQGTFANLDFEGGFVSGSIPGWTAYIGNTAQAGVLYNNLPLAWQPGVALFGPEWQPIAGNYSAYIFAGYEVPGTWIPTTAALAQTGTVPFGSLSLRFIASGDLPALSLGGQSLDPVMLGPNLYGADITSFQGQYLELRFTAPSDLTFPNQRHFLLDSIVFSPEAVPEPTSLALLLFGGIAMFALVRAKRRLGQ